MSRLMSVSLTEDQVRARTKTVTRRLGWRSIHVGDRLTLCRKVMGRRNGEPLVRICDVEVIHISLVTVSTPVDDQEAAREGFPDWSWDEFVAFFCEHMKCTPETVVRRIEWRYLEDGES